MYFMSNLLSIIKVVTGLVIGSEIVSGGLCLGLEAFDDTVVPRLVLEL